MKRNLFSVALLLGVVGCSRSDEARPAAASLPPVVVQAAAVQAESLPQLTEISGMVRPMRRAVLASKQMGTVSELFVTLGQPVKAGEVLLKIFSADLAARLTQARVELNVARRDFAREQDLLAKGASTAETVRNLEDRVAGREAMVRDAEVQLSYTEIRAPFDGVIARRPVNAGDFAVAGQPLLEIEGTTDFEIETCIPDSLAAPLELGASLNCEVADIAFRGVLREISSAADPSSHCVGVKIAVPAGASVRSGQFARVQVPGAAARVILVPATAITVSGQMERVFVVGEGNRASLRLVKTGAALDDRVEILSGIAAEERVVIAPPAGLRDGQPLQVQP